MAEILPMLALSPTMEEGTLVSWVKKEGESIAADDIICEVETDKATMEYESPAEGTLLKILVAEGGSVRVGEPIAVIGEAGEDFSDLVQDIPSAPPADAPSDSESEVSPTTHSPPPTTQASASGRILSSPLARKLADKYGLDLRTIKGSGPHDRIIKRDIEGALKAKPVAPAPSTDSAPPPVGPRIFPVGALTGTRVPVNTKRRIIADRLSSSKFSAPHYYLKIRVIMDAVMQARADANKRRSDGKLSVNAFMMKFVAAALKKHPMLNASWQGDHILQFDRVDVALAVALEDGLITPVVRDCLNKSIPVIDTELKDLIPRAQEGKLKPEEFNDAPFTVSSLGSFGIEEFTAVINPPASAILAIGAIQKEYLFDEEDQPELHQLMRLTLSCDHRVVDGAKGALFLKDLKEIIENPFLACLT